MLGPLAAAGAGRYGCRPVVCLGQAALRDFNTEVLPETPPSPPFLLNLPLSEGLFIG